MPTENLLVATIKMRSINTYIHVKKFHHVKLEMYLYRRSRNFSRQSRVRVKSGAFVRIAPLQSKFTDLLQ